MMSGIDVIRLIYESYYIHHNFTPIPTQPLNLDEILYKHIIYRIHNDDASNPIRHKKCIYPFNGYLH